MARPLTIRLFYSLLFHSGASQNHFLNSSMDSQEHKESQDQG